MGQWLGVIEDCAYVQNLSVLRHRGCKNHLGMTSAVPVVSKPLRAAAPAQNSSLLDERQQLISKAQQLFEQASELAAQGEINESGLLILKAFDCERRAKAHGPQVLGLIRRRT